MTNQPRIATQLADHPQPDPPTPQTPPQGIPDHRGTWQDLDEDGSRDAAA